MASESVTGVSSSSSSSSSDSSVSTGSPPIVIFQGYDTFTNSGIGTAVTGETGSTNIGPKSSYSVCTSYTSLQTTLAVSASASAVFGAGSLDAKAGFMESLKVTTFCVTVVVRSYECRKEKWTKVQLLPQEELLVDPSQSAADFCLKYGDSFVGEIAKGKEYLAVWVFYAETQEQQDEILGTLEANYISPSGGELSAELDANLTKTQKKVTTRQAFASLLLGVSDEDVDTSGDPVEFAMKTFPGLDWDDQSAAVISYTTEGYERVLTGTALTLFQPVIATRQQFNGTASSDGLSDQYAQLKAASNAIDSIKTVYDTYHYDASLYDQTLLQREEVIDQNAATLEELFLRMSGDATQAYDEPELEGLAWGSPALNVVLRRSAGYGGTGGSEFDDTSESMYRSSSVLRTFRARGGDVLDMIASLYSGETSEHIHGSDDSDINDSKLSLQTSERVKSISGTWGRLVNSIKIVTYYPTSNTPGRTFAWPPHPEGTDGKYSWSATATMAFLGFAGRSGRQMDQLVIVGAEFGPAEWPSAWTTTSASPTTEASSRPEPETSV